jgi:adenosylhomocysteine nucleosidase
MRNLGVIAAFPGELRPLIRGWRPVPQQVAWQGRIGQTDCVAVAGGMGRDAAARACSIAQQLAELDALVSLGWAGALSCGMHPGRAYPVAEVIDPATGERFSANQPGAAGLPLRLVTIDHVAQAQEKRALAEKYQAVLVDMEAATVARLAGQKSLAFYCLKAVTDAATDMLPDFSRYGDAQGRLRMPVLLAHLAIEPRYWRSVARMSKNSKTGAEAVAEALRELVETHADHVDH